MDKTIQSSSLSAILVPGASLDQKYEAFSVCFINFPCDSNFIYLLDQPFLNKFSGAIVLV